MILLTHGVSSKERYEEHLFYWHCKLSDIYEVISPRIWAVTEIGRADIISNSYSTDDGDFWAERVDTMKVFD